MNMKFAALLLFVGATSATWCIERSSNTCPKETYHGEATLQCCDSIGVSDHDRGCTVYGDLWTLFTACCINEWACDGVLT